jgi:hypothetical protein
VWRINLTQPPHRKHLQLPLREILVVHYTPQTLRRPSKLRSLLPSRRQHRFYTAIMVLPREAELSPRLVVPYFKSLPSRGLSMELILVVVVLVLLFGGGGYWGRRRGHW